MINDPNAIQHVLSKQTTVYHLESSLREFLRVVTGKVFCMGSDLLRTLTLPRKRAYLLWWYIETKLFYSRSHSVLLLGIDHARQRKLLQPAFKPSFIKSLVPQIVDCAIRVCQIYSLLLNFHGSQTTKEWDTFIEKSADDSVRTTKLDLFEWLERITMEIIGQSDSLFGLKINFLIFLQLNLEYDSRQSKALDTHWCCRYLSALMRGLSEELGQ